MTDFQKLEVILKFGSIDYSKNGYLFYPKENVNYVFDLKFGEHWTFITLDDLVTELWSLITK